MSSRTEKVKLLLVRHGESEANAGMGTESPHTIKLTGKGEGQARELPQRITVVPNLIIVTEHIRTLMTAQGFMAKHPSVPVETWPLHEFTFLSPALCKGTTAVQRLPWVNEYWERCDPDYVHGEGAESFNGFIDRVGQCLKDMSVSGHNTIIVFAHGHVMRAVKMLMEHGQENRHALMRYYRDTMLKMDMPNTHILEIDLPRSL